MKNKIIALFVMLVLLSVAGFLAGCEVNTLDSYKLATAKQAIDGVEDVDTMDIDLRIRHDYVAPAMQDYGNKDCSRLMDSVPKKSLI